MELGSDDVGEFVVATAVSVDGPEHGTYHAGVSARFAQLVLGSGGGSLTGDDVVYRLTDDRRRRVSSEETDGNLVGGTAIAAARSLCETIRNSCPSARNAVTTNNVVRPVDGNRP